MSTDEIVVYVQVLQFQIKISHAVNLRRGVGNVALY